MITLMTQSIYAQQNPQGGQRQNRKEQFGKQAKQRPSAEQMAEMQSARLANELMLDDANTAKFKDIYQSYQKDLQAVRQKFHPKKQEQSKKPQMKERKELTDQEVEERILNQMKEQKEMLNQRANQHNARMDRQLVQNMVDGENSKCPQVMGGGMMITEVALWPAKKSFSPIKAALSCARVTRSTTATWRRSTSCSSRS